MAKGQLNASPGVVLVAPGLTARHLSLYPELNSVPPSASAPAREIANLPVLRPLQLRNGVTLKSLAKGKANLEAALAYMRGAVVASCQHCKESSGPFARSVVLESRWGKSCCNCKYNDEAARCSFRRMYLLVCFPNYEFELTYL